MHRYIENLQTSPWTLSAAQRTYVAEEVSLRAPCNFLVWGIGYDSDLWRLCNDGGSTIIVEDNSKWIDRILAIYPSLDVVKIFYTTRRWQWRRLIDKPELLQLALPARITRKKWDAIFIDAPVGWAFWHPGRMQSVYSSYELVSEIAEVDVFVHDTNRRVESVYSNGFFGQHNRVRSVGNLWHYRTTL